MASVHRVTKRVRHWWLVPIGLLVAATAVLFWPKPQPAITYLVAAKDLPAGAQVTQANFESRTYDNALGESVYLMNLKGTAMLTRSLVAGELVTKTAITPGTLDRRTPVVLAVQGGIAHTMRVGSTVDVWATTAQSEPAAIALDATVLEIKQSNSLGKVQTSAEIAVASEYLPALMQAKASNSFIELLLQPTLADQ